MLSSVRKLIQRTLADGGRPDTLPSYSGRSLQSWPPRPMSRDEEIFAEAREIPPAARAAYLDRACTNDPAMRAQIEELLAGFEAVERDLPRAFVARTAEPFGEKPSERIGRYKLLEKIGEGGCGVVWLAEQEEPVRRRVALKVIKLGMDTKAVIARFEAERQALALMDHPNIAKVLDAGATESGRPFFVMELVRGVPITTYCDKHHLPPRARLELFGAVCAAIQHAHEKGIIHRDIKPTNILVTVHDGAPMPKVIDFGIAKATQGRLTEHTLFTSFEQFIGTPVYMSPEQAEMSGAEVDPRSDIYSLGVLLYELLTGQPLFNPKELAQAGVDEIRRRIREVEPPRPSTRWRTLTEPERASVANLRGTAPAELSLLLRGDLDWIVMRCLEKDRTRRYESAAALAADLQRHARHEPVVARPPSTAYVLGKFVRRHRVRLAAAAAVVLALIGGAASVWQARRAARAEQLAAGLTSPAAPAPAPLSPARQLAVRARAMSYEKYDSSADDYAAAEGLIKQALALDQNDPEVWAISSQFNTSIRTRGFDHAPARREMARRDAKRALKLEPDSREGLFALGRAQRDIEPDAAEQTFRKILARYPDEPRTLGQLAWMYDQTGRPDEAAALYARAAADSDHAALTHYTEYLLFFHYRRFAEADRAIRQSVALQPSANSQAGLAMLLLTWKGDADGAAGVLAGGPTAARNEARTIWTTAFVQLCRRDPDAALKALDRLGDDFLQDNWFTGPKAYFAGRAHALAGRPEAARIAWESALALTNQRLKDTPDDRVLRVVRGQLLAWLGSSDEALREARAVAELSRSGRAEWYWFCSPALIYAALGRADEALPLLQKLSLAPAGQFLDWPLTPALLRLDPVWDKIRDDPRFQKLATSDQPTAMAAPNSATDATAASPAVALANRARALYDKVGFTRDDLILAEDFAKRATDGDPTAAYGWGVQAQVQAAFLVRGFAVGDESERRAQDTQSLANRALTLNAAEPEALLALGHLATNRRAYAQAEEILAGLLAAHPDDNRIRRALGAVLRQQPDRVPEALTVHLEAVRRDPRDALAHYDLSSTYRDALNFPAAWEEIQTAVALNPFDNALISMGTQALAYKGSVPEMRAALDRLSPADRTKDRGVYYAMFCGLLERRPERVIAAANLNPRDYFEDNFVAGPKAWFVALAYELAGQQNSARAQWLGAERLLRDRVRTNATNRFYRIQLAVTLARLGRTEEAAREMDPIEAEWREQLDVSVARWLARYYGSTGDAPKAVFYLRRSMNVRTYFNPAITLPSLRFDPWWDKLRGAPEFQELLANPPTLGTPLAPAPYRGSRPRPRRRPGP